MNKYYVFFHLVTGRDIRATLSIGGDIEDEAIQCRLADALVDKRFMHFLDNGKFVIINMDNVASITVTKAE
jgi:hypothetical protein